MASHGLMVWDGRGVLLFDSTYRLGRILGMIEFVGGSGTSGAISHAGFSTGTPFYQFRPAGQTAQGAFQPPSIWISGVTLNWAYGNNVYSDIAGSTPYDHSLGGTITYGVH